MLKNPVIEGLVKKDKNYTVYEVKSKFKFCKKTIPF